jgi:hypothetical protein
MKPSAHDHSTVLALCEEYARLLREHEVLSARAEADDGEEIKHQLEENQIERRIIMLKILDLGGSSP